MMDLEKEKTARATKIPKVRIQEDIQVAQISMNLIRDNPFQARKRYPKEYILGLADSIHERGLLQPISVVELGGKYVIVAGHCRFRAFRKLHRTEIPAIIRKKSTQEDLALDVAIENAMRKDINPVEKAQAILNVLSTIPWVDRDPLKALCLLGVTHLSKTRGETGACKKGMSEGIKDTDVNECRKLMKSLNMAENTATTYLRLMTLSPALQEKIVTANNQIVAARLMKEGCINVRQGYELSRLKDPQLRQAVYDRMIKEGWRYIELRHIVGELLKRGATGGNLSGLGTCKDRVEGQDKVCRLTHRAFEISSSLANSRPTILRMGYSLEKAENLAALEKLRKACLDVAEQIGEVMNLDDGIELANVDFSIDLKKPSSRKNRGNCYETRYQLKRPTRLKLNAKAGDRLVLKCTGIIRSAVKAEEDPEEEDAFEDTLNELGGF